MHLWGILCRFCFLWDKPLFPSNRKSQKIRSAFGNHGRCTKFNEDSKLLVHPTIQSFHFSGSFISDSWSAPQIKSHLQSHRHTTFHDDQSSQRSQSGASNCFSTWLNDKKNRIDPYGFLFSISLVQYLRQMWCSTFRRKAELVFECDGKWGNTFIPNHFRNRWNGEIEI